MPLVVILNRLVCYCRMIRGPSVDPEVLTKVIALCMGPRTCSSDVEWARGAGGRHAAQAKQRWSSVGCWFRKKLSRVKASRDRNHGALLSVSEVL